MHLPGGRCAPTISPLGQRVKCISSLACAPRARDPAARARSVTPPASSTSSSSPVAATDRPQAASTSAAATHPLPRVPDSRAAAPPPAGPSHSQPSTSYSVGPGLSDLSRLPGDPSRSRYRAPFADSGGAAATQQPPLRGGRPPLTFVRPGADAFRAAGSIAKYLRECPSLVVGCSPEAAGLAVRALAVAHDYVAEREPYGLVFQLHSARLRPSDSRPEVLFTAFKCPTAFAQRVISVSTNGEAPPPPTQTPPAPPVRATSAAARAASVDTPSSGRSSSSGGSDGGDALPRPQRHRGMVLEVARESTPEKLAGKLMGMFLTYGCMTLQLSHPAAIAAAAGALLLARQRLLASGVRSDMTITTSRRSAAAASGGSSSSSTFAPSGGDAAIPAAATGAASTNNLADGGPDGGGGDDSSGPPPLQLHVVGTRPLMPLQMINLPKFRRTQKARLAAQRAEQRPQQEPE